ncbi:hypothetical protein NDU88_003443 [Pleurodeles waltl]|uniref:Uncharacterized protein n=1 Tax=Pleurodeles waltl TaxID=8319 RepID=A0AAV7UG64_PLEWA|nr:hypothetical protein NDU88_003443 [Pleurodeles waltl]
MLINSLMDRAPLYRRDRAHLDESLWPKTLELPNEPKDPNGPEPRSKSGPGEPRLFANDAVTVGGSQFLLDPFCLTIKKAQFSKNEKIAADTMHAKPAGHMLEA